MTIMSCKYHDHHVHHAYIASHKEYFKIFIRQTDRHILSKKSCTALTMISAQEDPFKSYSSLNFLLKGSGDNESLAY